MFLVREAPTSDRQSSHDHLSSCTWLTVCYQHYICMWARQRTGCTRLPSGVGESSIFVVLNWWNSVIFSSLNITWSTQVRTWWYEAFSFWELKPTTKLHIDTLLEGTSLIYSFQGLEPVMNATLAMHKAVFSIFHINKVLIFWIFYGYCVYTHTLCNCKDSSLFSKHLYSSVPLKNT